MLARTHTWLDRHPLAADAVLAVVLLGFSLSTLTSRDSHAGVAGVVFSVLLTAPLVLRRRAPVAVFATVMVVCGVALLFVDEFIGANAGALVALYTLVVYAPRRLAAIGFAVMLAGAAPYAAVFDNPSSTDAFVTWLLLVFQIALAAVLGDRTHARLRDRARLEERARLLAAERDQQATIAAAAERARIARELHDVVAHSLSVVIAQADGGRYAAEQDPGQATAALQTIADDRARGPGRDAPGAGHPAASGRARRSSPSPASASCRRWSRARATPGWRSSSPRRATRASSRPPPA